MSLTKSIGLLVLSAAVIAWSELYLPTRESIEVDVIRLAGQLYSSRTAVARLRVAVPRLRSEIAGLAEKVERLAGEFTGSLTSELFLAVSPSTNRLYMRRGERVQLEAIISTGTNDTLRAPNRKWVFETPRGIMTVIRKKKDPVWLKPDWAFLEKGEKVPPWNSPLRRQKGMLGDFMLDLGGGVMIHGTPQEHLLGRSVTHGCIRVGSGDLKVLYDSVPMGTKVYIY